ncbi:MAG: hypothetical protein ACOZBH_05000 [Patescibacteria group bacterium]
MNQIKQKSIEQYFADHGVVDPDAKAQLLPQITQLIYDRNIYVVKAEKEDDQFKKEQITKDAEEMDKRIEQIIKDSTKK